MPPEEGPLSPGFFRPTETVEGRVDAGFGETSAGVSRRPIRVRSFDGASGRCSDGSASSDTVFGLGEWREAEEATLRGPIVREMRGPVQCLRVEPLRLATFQDRCSDVGSEECESEAARDTVLVYVQHRRSGSDRDCRAAGEKA